jgi:hypothetical protein
LIYQLPLCISFVSQTKLLRRRKKNATLLDIPCELRDEIYRNLLVIDQGPECIPDRGIAKNFPFGVLGVNRQIRKEALRVCPKENTWIHIILISQDTSIEADKKLLGNLAFRLPQTQIRLRADDMPAFVHETSLGIYLGSGLKALSIKKQNTAQENELFIRITFAYTQRAFGYSATISAGTQKCTKT